MVRQTSWYNIALAWFVALGSFLWGYDSGVITTSIAQPSFESYFRPTPEQTGAVVSSFAGGGALGCILAGLISDRYGRKGCIAVGAAIALVGTSLQAAAVQIGMLIAGRITAGVAIGVLFYAIPMYLAEISPPQSRGFIVGIHAQLIGVGFAVSNWVGYGCYFAKGQFAWRFPLAFQTIPAIILLVGLPFVPQSPRWLIEHNRLSEARQILLKLHAGNQDPTFWEMEFEQIQTQIAYEKEDRAKLADFYRVPSYRRRLLVAILVECATALTGINVVNYYQTTMYAGLGVTGSTVLLIAGFYGMVGPATNVLTILKVDKWGRRRTMILGAIALALDMVLEAVITARYAGTDNKVGNGFGVLFIFLFSILYSLSFNSQHSIYTTEIFPTKLRARGGAICTFCSFASQIAFNQASPTAFEKIGWKYYIVFIVINLDTALLVYLFCPETKGRTLEEINELFGDVLAAERITEPAGKGEVEERA